RSFSQPVMCVSPIPSFPLRPSRAPRSTLFPYTTLFRSLREKQYRVITIEATEKPQNAKLRVAAYARVSSASDDQLNSFAAQNRQDRKSTRLNSSHVSISYAVFCLKKKTTTNGPVTTREA